MWTGAYSPQDLRRDLVWRERWKGIVKVGLDVLVGNTA